MTHLFSREAFNNKRIVISGGAGDIAAAIAIEFAKAGASQIALLDKDVRQLEIIAEKITSLGSDCVCIALDLANAEEIKKAIDSLYSTHSVWDILVTAAGLYIGGKSLCDSEVSAWDQLMEINARSVFLLSKLIAKKMLAQKHGKIIHISSGSTYLGTPGSGLYAASKSVINQLTQTMAVELGPHNIQVNALCPTVTQTKFLSFVEGDKLHEAMRNKLKSKMPLGRLLEPSDIAPAVLFLASEGSQLINGAIIPIDGGSRLVST